MVCGSDAATPHWRCDGFGFVRCLRCRHIYQSPRPVASALFGRYDQEYADYEVENSDNFLDLMLKGLDDVKATERVAARAQSPSALDVGCATGALIEHLARRGWRVQGVEPCEPAASYGVKHRKVPIHVGTVDELSDRQRYSLIHSSHVIEHVPDPRRFLIALRDRLEDEGVLVIVTPNTAGLQPKLFAARWRSAIADHVNLFSLSGLTRVASEIGLRRVASKTWGGLGIGTAPKWIKSPVDRLAKAFGFGDVMLLMFEKPSKTAKAV